MKFSEKLEANWKVGKYTLVKDLHDGEFALFTTKDRRGSIRNTLWASQEKDTLFDHTHDVTIDKSELDKMSLQIIRTIDPMELMGPGYEEGQKVRILPNAKEECEKSGVHWNRWRDELAKRGYGFINMRVGSDWALDSMNCTDTWIFPASTIEPYFEDEEVTEIAGVKYSKADIEALVKSAKDLKPIK